jgi:glycosyltransferase involved in cell wall biosynthesis
MRILWLSWKDARHPLAGGAEVVADELIKRLAADGHEVTMLSGGWKGAAAEETFDGRRTVRLGNRYSIYYHTWRYYRRHLRGWADVVIDEVNTVPFFAKYYVREPNVVLAHMLCRQIWFYQMPFPLSVGGYLAEPLYLRLLSDRRAITVSESTRRDLVRHGFRPDRISIISEGIQMKPLGSLSEHTKYAQPTVISLGALRAMKRTLDQVKAFEIAKASIPNLQLRIAGDASGRYGRAVLRYIAASPYAADIKYLGRISHQDKTELMQRGHAILVTSVKEGWGLIVTEAASQGTPAVVYNVDGLRDSVRAGQTGLVAQANTPAGLAQQITALFDSPERYASLRRQAWEWSREITFDRSYVELMQTLKAVV